MVEVSAQNEEYIYTKYFARLIAKTLDDAHHDRIWQKPINEEKANQTREEFRKGMNLMEDFKNEAWNISKLSMFVDKIRKVIIAMLKYIVE